MSFSSRSFIGSSCVSLSTIAEVFPLTVVILFRWHVRFPPRFPWLTFAFATPLRIDPFHIGFVSLSHSLLLREALVSGKTGTTLIRSPTQ